VPDLDEWDEALVAGPADGADDASDKKTKPKFPSVERWVTDWFAPMVTQRLNQRHCWCPQWWQHAEGILRLEALWRSWEHLHRDPTTGLSVWLRDHRDPHLGFLLDQSVSPFVNCSLRDGHRQAPAPLKVLPVPVGWEHPDAALHAVDEDDEDTADEPKPQFPDVQSWVTNWLSQVVTQRPERDTAWCPSWWEHLEGVRRLDALWRSWEHLRLDGTTGMSVWLRDHRDPHLGFLLDRSVSPFVHCSPEEGHSAPPASLPVEQSPADWWSTGDE